LQTKFLVGNVLSLQRVTTALSERVSQASSIDLPMNRLIGVMQAQRSFG
jgi:hypothetical protein